MQPTPRQTGPSRAFPRWQRRTPRPRQRADRRRLRDAESGLRELRAERVALQRPQFEPAGGRYYTGKGFLADVPRLQDRQLEIPVWTKKSKAVATLRRFYHGPIDTTDVGAGSYGLNAPE
jgi:hypothetical protein